MKLVPSSLDDEFSKHPELTNEAIQQIKDWMDKEAHLPTIPDRSIAIFLHSCYYSVERTKKTIENYYTVRTHVPEFFSNRDPAHPTVASAIDATTYFTFSEKTDKGDTVIYAVLNDPDPSKYVFVDAMKYFTHIEDMMLYENGSQNGIIIVFDLSGVSFGHLPKLGIMGIKKYLYYLQEAMPVRLKGLHFINVVSFMDKIVALMKPFMKQELMKMLHIHSDGMKSFYEFVPQKIMPAEFGGKAPDLKTLREQTIQKVIENGAFFIEEEKLRVNEALRTGKPKNVGEIFGVEGSFKKLDID